MFVIRPEKYSIPCYRIGPFRTQDISINYKMPSDNFIDEYFKDRFGADRFFYFPNGRSAIGQALSYYKLKETEIVTIFTTTGNKYIAKCVTDEIEKTCRWSRVIEENTKVILVNHEFGYPFPNLEKLKEYNLPIIEDCAHSFFSVDIANTIGKIGDFVVYSFPKIFPIQIGGLLVSNIQSCFRDNFLDPDTKQYIKNVLSSQIKFKDKLIKKRISNYKKLRKLLSNLGFEERFKLEEGIVPSVFMFRNRNPKINLSDLKQFVWDHGIQCSILYSENTFFIPTHQNLGDIDLLYFNEVIRSFINEAD